MTGRKTCPNCHESIACAYRNCPHCNYAFVSTITTKVTHQPALYQPITKDSLVATKNIITEYEDDFGKIATVLKKINEIGIERFTECYKILQELNL